MHGTRSRCSAGSLFMALWTCGMLNLFCKSWYHKHHQRKSKNHFKKITISCAADTQKHTLKFFTPLDARGAKVFTAPLNGPLTKRPSVVSGVEHGGICDVSGTSRRNLTGKPQKRSVSYSLRLPRKHTSGKSDIDKRNVY